MGYTRYNFTVIFLLSLVAMGLPAGAESPVITGIENNSDDNSVNIIIKVDAPCTPESFALNEPDRLVVDFPGADTSLVPFKKEFDDPVLKAVRIGRPTPETVRVVLDLSYLLPYSISQAGGSDVLVSLNRKVESRTNNMDVLTGINYSTTTEMTDNGPLAIHVLDINLNEPGISVYIGIGEDRLGGREKLTSLVKRKGAVIGVNGGYFSTSSGLPIDLLIVRNKVLLLPDRYRGFFGVNNDGVPVFMRPNTEISIRLADEKLYYVHLLNWPPSKGKLAIFTPEYGKTTGTSETRKEVVIEDNTIKKFSGGNSEIPENGFVLSADESHTELLDKMKVGEKAVATISSYPDIRNVAYGFSAGPILVKEGELEQKLVEDFTVSSGIVAKRNPRTAAGRTNNNHLLLVVVEGRNPRSIGMTLGELGKLMLSLGAVDAINLDGGGSSEMVIGGKIVNRLPSGQERPLANAVLIFHK